MLCREGAYVVPGDKCGPVSECCAGVGTYVFKDFVVSHALGRVKVSHSLSEKLPTLSVEANDAAGAAVSTESASGRELALAIGDEVLCKVKRLNPRFASVDIVCKGTSPLVKEFAGIVRVQDVRASEIDKVSILTSFRPGDIIRAEVISLGESHSLLLSTAKVHLGVLHAKSAAGQAMVPISWDSMQCPVTKTKEQRKVARPLDS